MTSPLPAAKTPSEAKQDSSRPKRRKKPRNGPVARWLRQHRKIGLVVETVTVIAGALLLSLLIKTFLMQPFYIPSESMNDTLAVGDRVLVSKLSVSISDVRRGDVIVFKDPGCTTEARNDRDCWLTPARAQDRPLPVRAINSVLTTVGLLPPASDQFLIKRIIGVGGDHVRCCSEDGRVEVNGTAITETYLRPGSLPSEVEFDVTVPQDHYWVMGDNRQNSQDSRYHSNGPGQGFVPRENVVGSTFARMWPVHRWAWMTNPHEVFADVP